MDDIFDFIVDLFLELFVWEQLNDYLRKKIPNRAVRWIITTMIYLLILAGLVAVLFGIYLIISMLI